MSLGQYLSRQEELRRQVEDDYARGAHNDDVLPQRIEDMLEEGPDTFNCQTLGGLYKNQPLKD